MSKRDFTASKTLENEQGEKEKKQATVYYEVGDNLSDLVDQFGEDTVRELAIKEVGRKLKSAIRRELKSGTDPEQVPNNLADWRPDVRHQVAKDPEKEAVQLFDQMSPDKQEQYLEKLRQKKAQG